MTELKYEVTRTYVYADGTRLSYDCIRQLEVTKSGGHKLINDQGGGFYIPPKWISIEFDFLKGHSWEV